MKNKITLSNPLTINNKKRTELTYDANEITAQMFAEADSRKLTASGSLAVVSTVPAGASGI